MFQTQACRVVINSKVEVAECTFPKLLEKAHISSLYWLTDECTIARKENKKALSSIKNQKGNLEFWKKSQSKNQKGRRIYM